MADRPARVVAAACDGACSGNPGPGGWGGLLRFEDGSVHELGGADQHTTNNRMELTAALALLNALRDLPRHPDLAIRTDSRYLIDGLGKWIHGWKRKGWRTASGGQVLNRDLWEQLDRARLADVSLRHVKGHSGDPDNERCDTIAVAFSRGQIPPLMAGEVLATARLEAEVPAPSGQAEQVVSGADGSDAPEAGLAPAPLQQLLTRLEWADRVADRGYGLSLLELAQLVEQPLRTLERRSRAWTWRDWRVEPLEDGRWRLRRGTAGLDDRP
ncbi:ribonuclease HI [Cyanobium sp. LEGE 06143]|uniref:ribonuclease H family protein n=1 Tax=unclassified Cyanobium TaxID=2627006 RepID=UPI0018815B75|nr:ribonuclease HI [Cyanobium sp. LEGE 06113]MBE9172345.1 ribonuclease HI [Cyanobium sp. LEGE 06143]